MKRRKASGNTASIARTGSMKKERVAGRASEIEREKEKKIEKVCSWEMRALVVSQKQALTARTCSHVAMLCGAPSSQSLFSGNHEHVLQDAIPDMGGTEGGHTHKEQCHESHEMMKRLNWRNQVTVVIAVCILPGKHKIGEIFFIIPGIITHSCVWEREHVICIINCFAPFNILRPRTLLLLWL